MNVFRNYIAPKKLLLLLHRFFLPDALLRSLQREFRVHLQAFREGAVSNPDHEPVVYQLVLESPIFARVRQCVEDCDILLRGFALQLVPTVEPGFA